MTARLSTLLNAGPPAGAPGGGASADWDAMVDEDGRSPLAVLDIDQDGRLDLLYARDGGEGYTLAETRLNRETGQEETVVHVLTRFGTGDADGSGPDDFVLEHEDGRVEVILRGDESETGSWRASAPDAASAQTLVNVVGGAVEDMADLPEGIESRSDYAQGLADGLGGLLDDLDAQTRADAKVSTLDVDGRGLVDLVIETAEGPDFLRELGLAGEAPRDSQVERIEHRRFDDQGPDDLLILPALDPETGAPAGDYRVVVRGDAGIRWDAHGASEGEARTLSMLTSRFVTALGNQKTAAALEGAALDAAAFEAASALSAILPLEVIDTARIMVEDVPGDGFADLILRTADGDAFLVSMTETGFAGLTAASSIVAHDLDGAGGRDFALGGFIEEVGGTMQGAGPLDLAALTDIEVDASGRIVSYRDGEGARHRRADLAAARGFAADAGLSVPAGANLAEIEAEAAPARAIITIDATGDRYQIEGPSLALAWKLSATVADFAGSWLEEGLELGERSAALSAFAEGLAGSSVVAEALAVNGGNIGALRLVISDFFQDGTVQLFALDEAGGLVATAAIYETGAGSHRAYSDAASADHGRSYTRRDGYTGAGLAALEESQRETLLGVSDINTLNPAEEAAALAYTLGDAILTTVFGPLTSLATWFFKGVGQFIGTAEAADAPGFDAFARLAEDPALAGALAERGALDLATLSHAELDQRGALDPTGLDGLYLVRESDPETGRERFTRLSTSAEEGEGFQKVAMGDGMTGWIAPAPYAVADAVVQTADGRLVPFRVPSDPSMSAHVLTAVAEAMVPAGAVDPMVAASLVEKVTRSLVALGAARRPAVSDVLLADLARDGSPDVVVTFTDRAGAAIFDINEAGAVERYNSPVFQLRDVDGDGAADYVTGRYAQGVDVEGMPVEIDLGSRRLTVGAGTADARYVVDYLRPVQADQITRIVNSFSADVLSVYEDPALREALTRLFAGTFGSTLSSMVTDLYARRMIGAIGGANAPDGDDDTVQLRFDPEPDGAFTLTLSGLDGVEDATRRFVPVAISSTRAEGGPQISYVAEPLASVEIQSS